MFSSVLLFLFIEQSHTVFNIKFILLCSIKKGENQKGDTQAINRKIGLFSLKCAYFLKPWKIFNPFSKDKSIEISKFF